MCAASSPPLRFLFLTPLDYTSAQNNREHNAVRYYVGRGDHVTLIAKRLNRTAGWRSALANGLTSRISEEIRDGATIRIVDPFLNFFGGIARQASAVADGGRPGIGTRLKRALIRLAKPLSVLREFAATGAFVTAAWHPARQADVVVAFGPWAALPAWLLKCAGRVKHLVYLDRDYEAGLFNDTRRAVTAHLEATMPRKADTFITIGPRLQALREKTTGRRPLICETGVDFDKFARTRARTGSTHDRIEVLYIGNVVDWSGVDLMIRALPGLPDRVSFRVIGAGLPAYIEELRHLSQQLAVAPRVTFSGPVAYPDIPTRMEGATIGFAASRPNLYRQYAYPLKVLEYFAAGLPVLATSDTEGGDIVRRADAGVVVDHDGAALGQALSALIGDPATLQRLRDNALCAARRMSWQRSFERERAAIVADLAQKGG